MQPQTFGGRIQGRLNGSIHDTLMLEFMREAQPLPESVERGRVRALHHSQVFQLIRDVLKDQLGAWESQLHRLNNDLKVAQREKADLETQGEATRLYELPRLAEQIDAERARADSLAEERSHLEARVESLERALEDREREFPAEKLHQARKRGSRLRELEATIQALEQSRPEDLLLRVEELRVSCERARASSRRAAQRSVSRECELEAVRGALEEHSETNRELERSNADIQRELESRVAQGRALEVKLAAAQGAFQDIWSLSTKQERQIQDLLRELDRTRRTLDWKTAAGQERLRQQQLKLDGVNARTRDLEDELARRQSELADYVAQEGSLREERELINAALATTDSAMESLREKLKAARRVQRLSQKLGTLSAPKGAQHLREARTDFVLFAELQAAQEALQDSWEGVSHAQTDLESVRHAVQDRVQGAAWLKKELASLRSDLTGSRRRAEKLERARWAAQASLEEREALVSILEEDLRKLEEDLEASSSGAETSRLQLEALQPNLEALRHELAQTCDDLTRNEAAKASLERKLETSERNRQEETERRRRLEGEALRALQETDHELANERTARKEHETVRFFLRSKVDRLQKALHRDGR